MIPKPWPQDRVGKKGKIKTEVVYRLPGDRSRRQIVAGSFYGRNRKSLANALLESVWRELLNGNDPKVSLTKVGRERETALTIASMFAAWKESRVSKKESTRVGDKSASKFWCQFLGANTDPRTVTRNDLQAIVTKLGTPGADGKFEYGAGTLEKYLTRLSLALTHAGVVNEQRETARKGVEIPVQPKKKKVMPKGSQWQALLAALTPTKWVIVIRFAECFGLRLCELRGITFENVNFATRTLFIPEEITKGGSTGERTLPLPDEFVTHLRGLYEEARCNDAAKPFGSCGETGLRRALERAAKKTGAPHVHPHLMRHRRVSLWGAMKINDVQIREWTGHASLKQRSAYSHVIDTADEWWDFWLDAEQEALGRNKSALRAVS